MSRQLLFLLLMNASPLSLSSLRGKKQNIDASLDSLHTLLRVGGTISSYRLVPTDAEEDEGGEITLERIQAKVAEVLGGKAADFNPATPLNDYGLDSLSSIEIVNWINR